MQWTNLIPFFPHPSTPDLRHWFWGLQTTDVLYRITAVWRALQITFLIIECCLIYGFSLLKHHNFTLTSFLLDLKSAGFKRATSKWFLFSARKGSLLELVVYCNHKPNCIEKSRSLFFLFFCQLKASELSIILILIQYILLGQFSFVINNQGHQQSCSGSAGEYSLETHE